MSSRRPGPPPESPEFGTFVSAPQSLLDADDQPLFDTLDRAHTPLQPSGPSRPMHVTLPPRPSEIDDDYVPVIQSQLQPEPQMSATALTSGPTMSNAGFGRSPSRSPQRRTGSFNGGKPQSPPKLTQRRLSVRTPGSPPAVNDSLGRDIIFHPAQASASLVDFDDGSWVSHAAPAGQKDGSVNESGIRIGNGNGRKMGESSTMGASTSRSPVHSRLLDTLATTAKVANKWRHSIEHDLFDPPPPQAATSTLPGANIAHANASSPTAPAVSLLSGLMPTVTHSSPFASAPQLAGSYVPPSGAPGYVPQDEPKRRDTVPVEMPIRLNGRSPTTQEVLGAAQAALLHRNLPPRQRLSTTWTLAYSLDQHGASLGTLYRNIERRTSTAPTGSVVVMMDAQGGVFGAFVNEPLKKREGQYYGTGESFLFKFSPQRDGLRIFRWTGKNQYFALCESGFMSFGGGGTYGLLVDSTMSRGSSATCKTYDNEVLCRDDPTFTEKAVRFDCIALEVWMTS